MQYYKRDISFIHTADLHLASPFSGISEKNRLLADYLHLSIFQSFDSIINLCIEKQVDFLLIAGDIFDSREKNLRALYHFIRGLTRLKEHQIPVIITSGNHDPLRPGPAETTIWDDILQIAGEDPPFTLITSDRYEPVDIRQQDETIARICGVSFSKAEIFESPVRHFSKKNDSAIPWIGLVHCTIGSHTDHIPYAPLTLSDLIDLGYDYWALGHIHAGYTVKEKDPTIIYPGNIQGRNWRETGPRGCIYTTIRTDGVTQTEFYETAPVRFETSELSIQGMEQEAELISAIENIINKLSASKSKTSIILSITLTGSGKLHQSLVQTDLLDEILQIYQEYSPSPPFCYLSTVNDATTASIDRDAFRGKGDIFDEICRCAENLSNESDLAKTREILAPLFHHHTLRHVLGEMSADEIKLLIQKAEDYLFLNLGAADED
jgi:exonuclease SbcD